MASLLSLVLRSTSSMVLNELRTGAVLHPARMGCTDGTPHIQQQCMQDGAAFSSNALPAAMHGRWHRASSLTCAFMTAVSSLPMSSDSSSTSFRR
eukprot:1138223-Pelagomonas_calceolata.AAC.3